MCSPAFYILSKDTKKPGLPTGHIHNAFSHFGSHELVIDFTRWFFWLFPQLCIYYEISRTHHHHHVPYQVTQTSMVLLGSQSQVSWISYFKDIPSGRHIRPPAPFLFVSASYAVDIFNRRVFSLYDQRAMLMSFLFLYILLYFHSLSTENNC